jgi:AcrR family transcriptional regulator
MISPGFLEAQRRRLFSGAAVRVVEEVGIREVTVTMLCESSRSARGTFYELFANKEACLRHAQAEGFELLFGETIRALGADGEWGRRVAAARRGLFAGAQADPELARFTLIHARGMPSIPEAPDVGMGVAALASLLGRDAPSGFQEEFVACLHVGLLSLRLVADDLDSLPGLAEELDWTTELLSDAGRRPS